MDIEAFFGLLFGGVICGIVNVMGGGGLLIALPILLALGLPAGVSNGTNRISIIFQDLSLSEVAEIHGISRQGVHDLVRRCDKLLEGYENKLHLVERFVTLKSSVSELRELTKAYEKSKDDKLFGQIDRLCQTILEEL